MPSKAYRDRKDDRDGKDENSTDVQMSRISLVQFQRLMQLLRQYTAENEILSKEKKKLIRENEYLKRWLRSYELSVERAKLLDVLKQIYEKKSLQVGDLINSVAWWNTVLDSDMLLAICVSGMFNMSFSYIKLDNGKTAPMSSAFPVTHNGYPEIDIRGITSTGKSSFFIRFACEKGQSTLDEAIDRGKAIIDNLLPEDYIQILHTQKNAFNGGSGDPGDPPLPNNFISAVSVLIDYLHMTRNEFSERSMLDVKTYDRIKRMENWHPKEETCKAILFALRPNIVSAFRLYELAGYSFKNCDEDKLLLAMFGVGDYDIDKYNEVMEIRNGKKLGSKPRK